ncbi:hypothetical protein BD324DRAFT_632972 [Kockovaella imperatae]|uniref:Uncharacterized protein n=1 Tax=Kockovaella imperatae TaxID=4999 RepID=A0A1Y1UBQ0_9TREE|nr:hypothetical protein BD324DRAFT_632972 [Kockovaella imperatae]ORX35470.1 hypothetical protein BD324DRAFT_632972 [Kockovaella imperatae]
MFEKLKEKLGAHSKTHPLAAQRDEFLAADMNTPLERKAHFSHEVVGAAAGYEALRAFENHEAHSTGTKVTHARAKEIVAGLASGFVVKLVEDKGLPFTSEADKHKFIAEAQHTASRDSKRTLRESGIFDQNELDPIDNDEKHAAKIA